MHVALASLLATTTALAAQPEDEALKLEAEPQRGPAGSGGLRVFSELAGGQTWQHYGLGTLRTERASLDIRYDVRTADRWRFVLSNRTDYSNPEEFGRAPLLNSLREAYVGWLSQSAQESVEIGRVNVRHGPGYGFNPTDWFRANSIRNVASSDPLAKRENRMGVVALRGQRFWDDFSLSLTYAPKLADGPSDKSYSPDWGATNSRDRWLAVLSTRHSERVSSEALLYKEGGTDVRMGVSLTSLLSNALSAHMEFAHSRESPVADRLWFGNVAARAGNRALIGATYTSEDKWSFTLEYAYNGFAASRSSLDRAIKNGPALAVIGSYLLQSERLQDQAARRAMLLYVSRSDLGIKGLSLKGFVRANADDHSRYAWLEFRYTIGSVELAAQGDWRSGGPNSEHGVVPYRRSITALALYRF